MPKTKGQHNPPWTREETILALNLLADMQFKAPPPTDPRVIELSTFLRNLPGNEQRAKNASFRNAAGVSFKLSNIQNIVTGKGFPNSSTMDRTIWSQFANRIPKLRASAKLIRQTGLAQQPLDEFLDDDENEFIEGRIVTAIHKRRERDPKLRQRLLRDRRVKNKLFCEVCGCPPISTDESFVDSIFEAHHIQPLSHTGEMRTLLRDVALLCANCHRFTHRVISKTGRWLTINEIKSITLKQ